jgi:ATP-dependent DNA helicase RecQ
LQFAPREIRPVLRTQFGHRSFRAGQEEIIREVLAGRDVLGVLPTGVGKSLTYQLPAQLLPGVTVVVSPLIALMKDQADSLEERGLEAGVIHSAQSASASEEELDEVRSAAARLLYVTPERLENEGFLGELARASVSLFVVDEAHCISEWGYDFRPAYLRLGEVVERLGRPPVLALTGTASPWIRRDITQQLRMRDPALVVRGFDRPNLWLAARRVEKERDELPLLERWFTGEPDRYEGELREKLDWSLGGSGIIYTATTKGAEETAEWLSALGVSADYYHGQRKKSERDRVQEAFMEGRTRVIAATNAFGLGVDKPDVRFVLHRHTPANLDSLYQEAGRAGRDGEFAFCALIYRPDSLGRAAYMSGAGELTRGEVERGRDGLLARPDATLGELAEETDLSKSELVRLTMTLKREGVVEEDRGRVRLVVDDFDPSQVSLEEEEARKRYERSRLEMMRGYAETTSCRREYILSYFGEEYEPARCGMCDNDLLAPATEARPGRAPEAPFAVGERVSHRTLGEGVVQRVRDGKLTVLFDKAGYKTLALEVVQARRLLESS